MRHQKWMQNQGVTFNGDPGQDQDERSIVTSAGRSDSGGDPSSDDQPVFCPSVCLDHRPEQRLPCHRGNRPTNPALSKRSISQLPGKRGCARTPPSDSHWACPWSVVPNRIARSTPIHQLQIPGRRSGCRRSRLPLRLRPGPVTGYIPHQTGRFPADSGASVTERSKGWPLGLDTCPWPLTDTPVSSRCSTDTDIGGRRGP